MLKRSLTVLLISAFACAILSAQDALANSSTHTHSAKQRHHQRSDRRLAGEPAGGLGIRSQRYLHRHHRRRTDVESWCSAGRRNAAVQGCTGFQRQCCLSDVDWSEPDRFSHLQDDGRRGHMDNTVREPEPECLLRRLRVLDADRGILHSDSVNGVFPDFARSTE